MLSTPMNRAKSPRSGSVLLISALALVSMGASRIAAAADPVIFSFATVGDSRQDPASPDATTLLAINPTTLEGGPSLSGTLLPQDAQWLQNTKPFARIIRTIQSEKPNLLFFNGDMIYGYGRPAVPTQWGTTAPTLAQVVGSDLVFEYTQYAFWRGIVAPLFETNTYVVPVPGNHETQCNSKDTTSTSSIGCATGKHAYAENENAFRANMSDLVNDLVTNLRFQTVSGFAAENVAGLTAASPAPVASTYNGPITGSQTDLSYSFDIATTAGLLHFVIINTDPSGADATAPADWLASDLAAAKSRGAAKYFVFGHKPAFTYQYNSSVAAGGLDANALSTNGGNPVYYRNQFWKVITQYGATYFCGHEHIPHVDTHADPTGTYAGTPYQVIVGSGGSPFDDTLGGSGASSTEPVPFLNTWDRYYAWALVQVHQSGAVSMTVQGFGDGATFNPSTGAITNLAPSTAGPVSLLYSISDLQ
jgi:hypothetical protein